MRSLLLLAKPPVPRKPLRSRPGLSLVQCTRLSAAATKSYLTFKDWEKLLNDCKLFDNLFTLSEAHMIFSMVQVVPPARNALSCWSYTLARVHACKRQRRPELMVQKGEPCQRCVSTLTLTHLWRPTT